MSLIQVARYSDVKYDFKDGYARVPVLEGAFDQARFAHCALQPGHSITPDVALRTSCKNFSNNLQKRNGA